ncbi:hypothetical protein HOV93_40500 [Planctomycetes bacterium FF15]|uniref:Uncharacterized protein n=1 Tax=Bremerella alba TaxID=980252 RepID=A0A7V9A8W8_9BACT|nr:hypothetical protein [Bremerella alba]
MEDANELYLRGWETASHGLPEEAGQTNLGKAQTSVPVMILRTLRLSGPNQPKTQA